MREDHRYNVSGVLQRVDEGMDIGRRLIRRRPVVVGNLIKSKDRMISRSISFCAHHESTFILTRICIGAVVARTPRVVREELLLEEELGRIVGILPAFFLSHVLTADEWPARAGYR